VGPVVGAAALGAGWGGGLFAVMVLACLAAAGAALRLGRHLPPGANLVVPPDASPARPEPTGSSAPGAPPAAELATSSSPR
jgi:hypothetical protein